MSNPAPQAGRTQQEGAPAVLSCLSRFERSSGGWQPRTPGAPGIRGELLRLGFDVSERSVSRYLRSLPRTPRANANWTTFLRNHRDGIAAMDFRHGRRDVVPFAVTNSPTAAWVAQQLREAFPFESAPRFMIFDRDAIFSAGLTATIRSMLMEPTRTSYRSPWQMGSRRDLSEPSAGSFSTTSSS